MTSSQHPPPSFTTVFINDIFSISAGVTSKVTGRMVSDTGWVWRVEGSGCTGGSGPRASRVATELDNPPRLQPSTRGPGPMDCRTATDQRPTLMEVRTEKRILLYQHYSNTA